MPQPSFPRRLAARAFLVLFGLLFGLVVAEVTLRVMTDDEDGHLSVRGMKLVPFQLLPERHRQALAAARTASYVVADPDLGWTIRPGGRSEDRLYAANADGLRSAPEDVPALVPGRRRVLLLGDSFTHGDEIPWDDTFAAQLPPLLGGAEVWNGGVPGYGSDQALLRGRRLVPRLRPTDVVLGVFDEDLERNVNLFRLLLHPWTHFPFSKPRFVLDGEGLRLVNSPALPPEQVVATLRAFDGSPLAAHERFWSADLYRDRPLYALRLVRFLASRSVHRENHRRRLALREDGGEAVLVTARIARLFCEETRAAGARPLVLILPGHQDVPSYAPRRRPRLAPLLDELARLRIPVADAGPALHEAAARRGGVAAYYVRGVGHPNREGCAVIASVLARALGE